MKKVNQGMSKAFLSLFVLFVFYGHLKGQNFFISGGHAFSASLCEDGKVFTWGSNNQGQLGSGLIGGNSNTPQLVNPALMPDIQAVDAGSGSHVVALGCDNTVWTWGANCDGQLGNGLGGGQSAAPGGACTSDSPDPVQVLTGEQSDPTGFLQNVTHITSGTSQSYAILDDGTLMAWGSNGNGQLGANIGVGFRNTPAFVRRKDNGAILQNVIAVDAQDFACYALTSDGQVWSWGKNGNAALACDGCGADQNAAVQVQVDWDGDNVADGPLNNGVMITAGDTHGLILDEDGFLWPVGGDWGTGQRGNPIGGFNNKDFATKVLSGEAKDSIGDNYLANVQMISASQAASAAVIDINGKGYLLTWGGNEHFSNVGGNGVLGIGATGAGDDETEPTFVTEFVDESTGTTYTNKNVVEYLMVMGFSMLLLLMMLH